MKDKIQTTVNKIGTRVAPIFMLFSLLISNYSNASVGEDLYNKMCMSCHSLTDKALVGPGFQGVGERRTEEWIIKWVHDPAALIASGDKDAIAIFEKFNKMPMPGFPQLKDDEIKELITFFNEKSKAVPAAATGGGKVAAASTGTTTESSPVEDDTTGTILFWSLVSVGIICALVYRFKKKTFTDMNNKGFHMEPHHIPNYGGLFFIYLLVGAAIIHLFIYVLAQKDSMVNGMMFVALPYVAMSIFLIGSIYRYKNRGMQVSSLSSQFLEGKKLFWGSQPFHWGLMVLFLGHLTAFLFPRAILAWNGEPVRLLILEVSSFAFALSALFGLIMLIKRRLTNKIVLVVTNKMDLVVYTVLITQIVSGLGVAFFVRWGSSWFSAVLTPYLRSVFSFNPDITAVSEMPVLIQIHIISAFLIIGIIPFTRFMHFLVAPIDYVWRKYQLVVWNWNRKSIRTSTRHNFGKKSRNH
jgi:nitrate reductase gamma subunit